MKKLIDKINKGNSNKQGIICLTCAINNTPRESLVKFLEKQKMDLNNIETISKVEISYRILVHFHSYYENKKDFYQQFPSFLIYLGEMMRNEPIFWNQLRAHEIISKSELIDVFADYAADLGIITYDISDKIGDEYKMDLFLTKKVPFLKTESVFIYTGHELYGNYNKELFNKIKEASKLTFWTVFVTTSYGAMMVGLDNLIENMTKFNVWLYIVDPVHNTIYGVTKGKKNDIDENLKKNFIPTIPTQSIRAPSQLGKISKYNFSEKNSYNPKKFNLYSLSVDHLTANFLDPVKKEGTYTKVFRKIIIIEKNSGLSMFSYSSGEGTDDDLVSGLLSAIDSFAHEISGKEIKTTLKEINYLGFIVNVATGKNTNIALFLSEPTDRSLKERLLYLSKAFEETYSEHLDKFSKTHNLSIFDKNELIGMIKEILSV